LNVGEIDPLKDRSARLENIREEKKDEEMIFFNQIQRI
jgi:hypothetical protein